MQLVGLLLVTIGAISYGLPGTLMKMADSQGAKTGGVVFFSFLFSSILLHIMYYLQRGNKKDFGMSKNDALKMLTSGGTIALSNACYFTSLSYIPVAVSAVLLMQSVWIAIALNCFLTKKIPTMYQSIAIIMILAGTAMGTGAFSLPGDYSLPGLILGFMAGFFYALTILFTGRLSVSAPPLGRAAMMSSGAFLLAAAIWSQDLSVALFPIEMKWGAIISIFSVVLPLSCFVRGMPQISSVAGSIISSLELPASIIFAWLLLGENINSVQICGVMLIISSVIISGLKKHA
jgi:drug/metabolite transporter (DMT)-like permease